MQKIYVIIVISILLFACSLPRNSVKMTVIKHYQSISVDTNVAFYKKPQQIPVDYETIGTVHYFDFYTWKIDTTTILTAVADSVKSIGANAVLIKKMKTFTIANEYFIGDILRVFDFNSPPDVLYTKGKIKKSEIFGKGIWDLRLSVPEFNHFLFKPENEHYFSSFGCLGALIGVDYYHADNQYLSLTAAAGMNFFLPFPAVVDYGCQLYDFCDYLGFSLSNNHRNKHFSIGYGLNFTHYWWRHVYYETFDIDETYINNALGFIFSTYFIPKSNFSIGIIHRPSFVSLKTQPIFKYEHLISLDFAWKMRLKTKKQYI